MGKMKSLAIDLEEATTLLHDHGRVIFEGLPSTAFLLEITINGVEKITAIYYKSRTIGDDVIGFMEMADMDEGEIISNLDGKEGFVPIEDFEKKLSSLKPKESSTLEINDVSSSIVFKATCLEFYFG